MIGNQRGWASGPARQSGVANPWWRLLIGNARADRHGDRHRRVANPWWRLLIGNGLKGPHGPGNVALTVANPWWRLLIGNTLGWGTLMTSVLQSVANPWWRLLIGNPPGRHAVPEQAPASRQSLVAPIDWKLTLVKPLRTVPWLVANPWWRLLIGNWIASNHISISMEWSPILGGAY